MPGVGNDEQCGARNRAVDGDRLVEAPPKPSQDHNAFRANLDGVHERQFQVGKDRSRERALARLRAMKKPLPRGFRFDRDEANAR